MLLPQHYEWAVGSSPEMPDDLLPWTFEGTKTRSASSVVPLIHDNIIFVSVKAFNKAGGTTVATSAPAIVNAGPAPTVSGLRCVGLRSIDPLVLVDNTGSGTVYAPLAVGIAIIWDSIDVQPAHLTWEVRRVDSWKLVVEPLDLIPVEGALMAVNYSASRPLHHTRNVTAAVTPAQVFVPGVSYVAVVVVSTPSGDSRTYVTNRVVFSLQPPQAGAVGLGAYAEHSEEWLGFADRVTVTWSAFRDHTAGVHHHHVCLLLVSAPDVGIDVGDTSWVVDVASPAVANATQSGDSRPVGACVDVDEGNTFTFPEATVLAITEHSTEPDLACSVSAVSFSGLVRTVMSSTARVDFKRPTPGSVTVPVVEAGGDPDLGSVTVTWTPFSVHRAPLVEYFVAVDREPWNDADELPDDLFRFMLVPQSFRSARMATSMTLNSLWMVANEQYYAIVVGATAAGTRNVMSSSPFVFHARPPSVLFVHEVETVVGVVHNTSNGTGLVPPSSLSSMLNYNPDSPSVYEDVFTAMLRYGIDLRMYGALGHRNITFQEDMVQFLKYDAVQPAGTALHEAVPVARNQHVDIDFQSTTTAMSLSWVLDSDVLSVSTGDVDHFELQIMQRAPSYRDVDTPIFPVSWQLLPHIRNMTLSGLRLQEGREYYAAIRTVATDGTFVDTFSDGVAVESLPPCVGSVNVSRVGQPPPSYSLHDWTPPSDDNGVADGTMYLPGNESVLLGWRAVVSPLLDDIGVKSLCTHEVEFEADYGALNTTFNMTDVFHPYGNLTQAHYNASAAASNETTWEEVHAELVQKVMRNRLPNEAPLSHFAVTIDLVSEAFEFSTNTSAYVDIGASANGACETELKSSHDPAGCTYANSSKWANASMFFGTSPVRQTTSGLFRFADPVCCSKPLPTLDEWLEADVVMAEVSSAAQALLPQKEAIELGGDVGMCSDFGQSVAVAEGPLLVIGGLKNGIIVSVTQHKHEKPFRYSSNLEALRATSTIETTASQSERLLCVRAYANKQAVVFAGDDVVKVIHVNRAESSVLDKLLLNMDGAAGVSVNTQFVKGTMATRVAVSVDHSELSGGLVTLLAMSGRFLITGEGFVVVLRIDDGRQLSSVSAYIQPRTQLRARHDPRFGTALTMRDACLAAWGPKTGVVLACRDEEGGVWKRAVLDVPEAVEATDEAHLFGSSLAMGDHVLVVGFPRSSPAEPGQVFVYRFHRASFSATVEVDAVRTTFVAPLLMLVNGTGIGQAVDCNTVDANTTAIVVGDRLTSETHVFKVTHSAASLGPINTLNVSTNTKPGSASSDRLFVMGHGGGTGNATENSTIVATAIAHSLVVQSVREPGNSSFSHLHVLSYCNPGHIIQRTAADEVDVTCIACPFGSTSLGGRTQRCVNCLTEFSPPPTGDANLDDVAVTCAPMSDTNVGGTPFAMVVKNLTNGLVHGREYRLTVHGTTRSSAHTVSASTEFIVDFTVSCLVQRGTVGVGCRFRMH